jgi:hypothetical protein
MPADIRPRHHGSENSAARKLHAISPGIARRLLDGDFNPHKDYDENKFLSSAWESLTSRLYPLLTDDVLCCFAGSDFTAQELMVSKQPISLLLIVNYFLTWMTIIF